MSSKKSLGKGLSVLLGDNKNENKKRNIEEIKVDDIVVNKNQPRNKFDQEKIIELAESIKKNGLLQPILVRKTDNNYELIAGERRLRATKHLNKEKILAIIIDATDVESAKYALIENIQRENLDPIEEALGYKKLLENYKLTQQELSDYIGKSRSYIANSMRILKLDKEVLDKLQDGSISVGHGKLLLSLGKEEQIKTLEEIIKKDLSVRDTESLIREINIKTTRKNKKNIKDPHIKELEDIFMKKLGTKVNFVKGKKKGKIEIEYYNQEDLDRIYDVIVK